MIRAVSLLVIVLLACGLAADTSFHIRIRFNDDAGAPLTGVTVTDGRRMWTTDPAGTAILPGSATPKSYRASRFGWKTLEFTAGPVNLTLSMTPDPVRLEPLRLVGEKSPGELEHRAETRMIPVAPGSSPQEALETVAGVWTPQTAYPGRSVSISVLGHRTRHTLVMIDGVPMNPNGEAFDLSTVPDGLVERIEVLPMGSGEGGSGEIGGVINLVTRKPDPTQNRGNTIRLGGGAGSFSGWKSSLRLDGGMSGLFGSVNLTATGARNDFPCTNPFTGDDLDRGNNDYAEHTADLVVESPRAHLSSWSSWRRFRKGLPGPVHQVSVYDHFRLDGESARTRIAFSLPGPLVTAGLGMFLMQETTELDNRESSAGYNVLHTSNRNRRWDATMRADATPFGFGVGVRLGMRIDRFDHRDEITGVSDSAAFSHDVSAALRITRDTPLGKNWTLEGSLSLRGDAVRLSRTASLDGFRQDMRGLDEKGLELTLRHGGFPDTRLSASLAETFTVPSFYDLFWKGDTQTVGNPSLKPETGRTARLGAGITLFGQEADLAWRHDRIDNLIYWYRSVTGWKPGNLEAAELDNLEAALTLKPRYWLEATGSWVRTFSADRSGGEYEGMELIYTPASVTKCSVSATYRILTVHADYQRTGPRWPTRDHLMGSLPAYEIVSSGLTARIERRSWELHFDLDGFNLLDKRYQEYDSEPQPGFRWEAGTTLTHRF